ncbi:tripartite tricarboxylate transporter substrate binding protein [Inquilinus sp. Marseille-Q2685]|uniref:tripartite tricarboxylate transporter substrate binding protein n=1 Tax=Inquilinus sp. Marseille-Q2685 TaxID=2866581 RepID=UPI001CE41AED|nr:tripartite tricarboxylate transporter substrate binding protein [Inquilinus sp. Marseille-Q2685]
MLKTVIAGLAGVVLAAVAAPAAQAEWPERPITYIVPWAAGGGTDAVSRILASFLEKELGQPVNVVNRTGGSGVVGHTAIATAAADGYTIGTLTVEINMMHWQGLTDLTWESYTPLALINADPAAIEVAADSPHGDLKALLEAAKANPGKLKASGTGQGGIWHLALAGMLRDAGLDPAAVTWVPSQGAAPGLQDLVAGGVDLTPVSLPEARSLIDAGKVRALAIMDAEPSSLYPDVPTLKSVTGSGWTMGAWRGVGGPKGMPEDVTKKLTEIIGKIVQSAEYQEMVKSRGFGTKVALGGEFAAYMKTSNDALGEVMKATGLAKQ